MTKLPRIIGFMGNIGAGKDILCDYLVARFDFVKRGFSDPLYKQLAILDPWIFNGAGFSKYTELVHIHRVDYVKRNYPEVRTYLQLLGAECGRDIHGPQCWVNRMAFNSRSDKHTCIRDTRHIEEIQWIRSMGGILIHVTSDREQAPGTHSSETAVDYRKEADYFLENNGSIEDAQDKMESILEQWAYGQSKESQS